MFVLVMENIVICIKNFLVLYCRFSISRISSILFSSCLFFFSSRRRHTRFDCDWSSDVCSSDLCQFVDDVSGAAGDAAYELLAVHLRACQAAPPGPVSLGGYLAGLLLNDEYVFEPDLDDYAELLGDQGAAVVRERIVTAYAENPASCRARHLRESIARTEGDVDAVIAIYAAQLDDHGRNHLRIASELDGAGRGDEALRWAERGLREAAHPDQQLVDYLARRYEASGRQDDVLSLRRDRLLAERTLTNYQGLRQAATASGVWPAERGQALALLTEDMRNPVLRASWAWSEIGRAHV